MNGAAQHAGSSPAADLPTSFVEEDGPPSDSSGPRGEAEAAVQPPLGWRRRLLAPLTAQLTQGVSPEKLSATLAVGTGCSMFPFLGTTSLLNLGVGMALRMNQPVLQTWNQLLGPVHLVMILVYVRLGEWIVGAQGAERFEVAQMLRTFREVSFAEFIERFGRAGLHASLAWLVTLPVLVGAVYVVARPVLVGLSAGLSRARSRARKNGGSEKGSSRRPQG
jgi:uncharacterized protein (DUF2062 family)